MASEAKALRPFSCSINKRFICVVSLFFSAVCALEDIPQAAEKLPCAQTWFRFSPRVQWRNFVLPLFRWMFQFFLVVSQTFWVNMKTLAMPCVWPKILLLLWLKRLVFFPYLPNPALCFHRNPQSSWPRLCSPKGDCNKCAVSPLCMCVMWCKCYTFFYFGECYISHKKYSN